MNKCSGIRHLHPILHAGGTVCSHNLINFLLGFCYDESYFVKANNIVFFLILQSTVIFKYGTLKMHFNFLLPNFTALWVHSHSKFAKLCFLIGKKTDQHKHTFSPFALKGQGNKAVHLASLPDTVRALTSNFLSLDVELHSIISPALLFSLPPQRRITLLTTQMASL